MDGHGVGDLDAPGMGPVQGPGPGIGGRYKVQPEDFVVEEIPLLPAAARGKGKYTVAMVRSKAWESHRLARKIAGQLDVDPEAVHFAGTKDKRAVATRMVAVQAPEERVRALDLGDVEIRETFRADRAPKLGELAGNRFTITVRGCQVDGDELADRVRARVEAIADRGGVPNYFGPQRFGGVRPNTHLVGEALVDGDVEAAVMAYVGHPFDDEEDGIREARRRLEEERDFDAARRYYPAHLDHERRMIVHLAREPGDWAGALRTTPSRLRTLFVYAYQSQLFNRVVARRLARDLPLVEPVEGDLVCDLDDHGFPDTDRLFGVHADNLDAVRDRCRAGKAWPTGPLFGTRTPLAEGTPGGIERSVLEQEGRRPRDFRIPELPELTSEGTRRPLVAPVHDLDWAVDGDAATLSFSLPKGTYATCVLREILA